MNNMIDWGTHWLDTYESSRRRGRVVLPLKQKDSAYLSMLENGELKPKGKGRRA